MKVMNKVSGIFALGIILFFLPGCSSFITFNDRAMSIDDVINISKTEIDSEVLISQIDVTHSKFRLTPQDIVLLKDEGVDDEVIQHMIESDYTPDRYGWEYGYSPYDYWFNYYNAYYYPIYDFYYGRAPYNYPSPYYGYPTPYISRRERGLVGKYYRYYPLIPPDGMDYYRRDRLELHETEDSDD